MTSVNELDVTEVIFLNFLNLLYLVSYATVLYIK